MFIPDPGIIVEQCYLSHTARSPYLNNQFIPDAGITDAKERFLTYLFMTYRFKVIVSMG